MPHFDQLKASLFKTVTTHMGYKAAWLSSVDDIVRQAAMGVTFKYPTLREKQFIEWDEFVYNPPNRIMEYFATDFPGLYELVENSNGTSLEIVRIYEIDKVNGELYSVGRVRKMFDGSIIYAQMYPYVEPEE